ncbi:hypothetical protein [Pseudomonas sp. LF090]
MSELRTFEISYTKDEARKTFVKQVEHFNDGDEWALVAQKFQIPFKDQSRGNKTPQTFRTVCIDTGYTDVTFVEKP